MKSSVRIDLCKLTHPGFPLLGINLVDRDTVGSAAYFVLIAGASSITARTLSLLIVTVTAQTGDATFSCRVPEVHRCASHHAHLG